MFRCYILHELCSCHIKRKESFSVILQYPAEGGGQPNGACELLGFKAGVHGEADEIICESSPSATLPTAWADLLISPPVGAHIYYITDGIAPFVRSVDPSRVHILEVSSPQQRRWKSFAEGLAAALVEQLYMPLVSLLEMKHLRDHIGILTEVEVVDRYKHLGGSVRGVIVRGRVPAEDLVSSALTHAGSLDAVLSSSTMSGELEGSGVAHIPSTLVHFRVVEEEEAGGPLVNEAGDELPPSAAPRVADPFTRFEAVFASNYIRSQIRLKFHSRFTAMLGEMVRTADLPFTSVLQGNLYEEFVHERMQAKRTNPCAARCLEPATAGAASSSYNLSSMPCLEFDDASDLAALTLTANTYYKPISRSFGAVDFVLGLDTVGNMTLNLRHGISITALLRVVRAMGFVPVDADGAAPVLSFFWLLPSRSLFKRMKKQPLSYAGRVISAIPSAASSAVPALTAGQQKLRELQQLVRVQQFAVYLPPEEYETEETVESGEEGEQEETVMDLQEESGETAAAALTSTGRRKRKVQSAAATSGASASKRRGRGGSTGAGGQVHQLS